MATLIEIVDIIRTNTGKSYDHSLKEILKLRIMQLRSLMIRRSVQRHGLDEELKMSVDLELISVDVLDTCAITDSCTTLRTKNKVPVPVRLSRGVPFDFVGTLGGIPYSFIRYGEHQLFSMIPIRKDIRGYYINNGYIYLVNGLYEEFLRVRHVFEDLQEATSFCTENCINDDVMDIFLPGDLVNDIINILTLELLNNPKYKELEIPTNDDIRNTTSK